MGECDWIANNGGQPKLLPSERRWVGPKSQAEIKKGMVYGLETWQPTLRRSLARRVRGRAVLTAKLIHQRVKPAGIFRFPQQTLAA